MPKNKIGFYLASKLPEFLGAFEPISDFCMHIVYYLYISVDNLVVKLPRHIISSSICIFVVWICISGPQPIYKCINNVYSMYTAHSLCFWANFQRHVWAPKSVTCCEYIEGGWIDWENVKGGVQETRGELS